MSDGILATRTAAPISVELARAGTFMPVMNLDEARKRRDLFGQFVRDILKNGMDYGEIPGTDKPTLLKPGAEKLNSLFGLTLRPTIIERTEDWTGKDHGGEPFFYYLYRVGLCRGDDVIAECDGSANSWEKKYRYRWVTESDVPKHLDKAQLRARDGTIREPMFAITKAETSGKYGKPAAYWQGFKDAIANKSAKLVKMPKRDGTTMDGWEVGGTLYRIPNEDMPDVVNTLQKIAQKRAMIGATLLATGASEFFTQDLDDMDLPTSLPTVQPPAPHYPDGGGAGVDPAGGPPSDYEPPFIEIWNEEFTERGATPAEAEKILKGMLDRAGKKSIDDVDGAGRRELLTKMRAGNYDRWLACNRQPEPAPAPGAPAPAPAGAPAPTPAAPAAKQAPRAASAPAPAPAAPAPVAADLDPLTDLYAQDADGFRKSCREASIMAGYERHIFDTLFDAHLLTIGRKGAASFTKMTDEEKRNMFLAFKEARFDRATGRILPAPR